MRRWLPRFSLYQLLAFVTLAALATAWRKELWELLTNSVLPIVLVLFGGVVLLYSATAASRDALARWGTIPCRRLGLLPPLCFLAGRWRVAYEFYRRGMAAISAGDHDRALTLASEAVRLEPALALYWAGRGFARYYLADYQAAIADLSQAIKLDRAVEQAHAYRGLAYLALNEPQLALDDLSLHACVGVDDAWVAWYRATAREEVFAWERAAEDYRLAYRLDESLHAAVICLARLQACCPLAALRDGAKAIANAERICVLEGWTNYISVSVLAAGYAESGDFATAIRYARQAHDLAPDDDKPNRLQRIEEYQRGECYRLPGLNFTVECNAP